MITTQPEMLRVGPPKQDRTVGVDRKQKAILGYVVAEEGNFKSEGRGRFNQASLAKLVELGNAHPKGLRQRFQHPTASDDGLGKHLGRASNFRLDHRNGRSLVRADAFFDKTALKMPVSGGTPYGEYLMDLAESDPGALQTSVVVDPKKIKTDELDELGEQLPPLWMPKQLLASDFVDSGDAVHGDLLGGNLDIAEWLGTGSDRRIHANLPFVVTQFLDRGFADADRATIEARFQGFLNRYLDSRFGEGEIRRPLRSVSDQLENLRKEFDSKAEFLKLAGYHDRETWVRHQCRDLGIEYKAAA